MLKSISSAIGPVGPSFSAYQSAAQTISSLTATKIAFQTEEWDTDAAFDPSVNYRFTPQVPGYYAVNATITLGSPSYSILRIAKNGTFWKESRTQGDISLTIACEVYLNGTTDYIEAYIELVTGQNLVAASEYTYFQASLARRA